VHGDGIIEFLDSSAVDCAGSASPRLNLHNPDCRADALLVDIRMTLPGRFVFGIRTADCVPLILRQGSLFALIHAGWRGLANGVIEKSIRRLSQGAGSSEKLVAAIGAAARGCCYTIGDEVAQAIGARAETAIVDGQLKLDTSKTAENIIRSMSRGAEISQIGACTICDRSYHSYRRSGEGAGRNLTFLICG
jgi:copper oxidase (laccase) domain-containing protein